MSHHTDDSETQKDRLIQHVGDEVSRTGRRIQNLNGSQIKEIMNSPSEEIAVDVIQELLDRGIAKAISSRNQFADINLSLDGWKKYTLKNPDTAGEDSNPGVQAMKLLEHVAKGPFIDTLSSEQIREITCCGSNELAEDLIEDLKRHGLLEFQGSEKVLIGRPAQYFDVNIGPKGYNFYKSGKSTIFYIDLKRANHTST